MPREHGRASRVADLIHRELALLVQREIKDPRLTLLTISEVKVSRDLAYADIYFTAFSDEDPTPVLKSAAGFLRSELAHILRTRTTPQLRFHYDHTLENGTRISKAIMDAVAEDDKRKED